MTPKSARPSSPAGSGGSGKSPGPIPKTPGNLLRWYPTTKSSKRSAPKRPDHTFDFDLPMNESRWIAARVSQGKSFDALSGPDIAHTSAIYVWVEGKPVFRPEAARWWIDNIRNHRERVRLKRQFRQRKAASRGVGFRGSRYRLVSGTNQKSCGIKRGRFPGAPHPIPDTIHSRATGARTLGSTLFPKISGIFPKHSDNLGGKIASSPSLRDEPGCKPSRWAKIYAEKSAQSTPRVFLSISKRSGQPRSHLGGGNPWIPNETFRDFVFPNIPGGTGPNSPVQGWDALTQIGFVRGLSTGRSPDPIGGAGAPHGHQSKKRGIATRAGGQTDEQLFFIANDGVHGRELYSSKGSISETSLLKDTNPGQADTIFYQTKIVNDKLFYIIKDQNGNQSLWKSDGTFHGTQEVVSLFPESEKWSVSEIIAFHDRIYFYAVNYTQEKFSLWFRMAPAPGPAY